MPTPGASARPPAPHEPAPAASPAPTAAPIDDPAAAWAAILRAAEKRPRVHSILADLGLARLDADRAVLAGRGPVCRAAEHSAKAIEEIIRDALGRTVRVEVSVEAADAPPPGAPTAPEARGHQAAPMSIDDDVRNHPLVQEAMEVLGAKIVRVERKPTPGA